MYIAIQHFQFLEGEGQLNKYCKYIINVIAKNSNHQIDPKSHKTLVTMDLRCDRERAPTSWQACLRPLSR
jgi:hypothetical protein